MREEGIKMKNCVIIATIIGILASWDVNAQTKEDISAVENYLNDIKTLSARFVQTASNGSSAEGEIWIAKPNKIRMVYAEPTDVLIVGNGEYIVYNDKELDQVTNIDYEDIPASLLLANDVKIDGKQIKVKDFHKDTASTSVTLEYTKGNMGPITLTFGNKPFELKKWTIVDPQNVEVNVSLYNTITDDKLDDNLFKFKREKDKKSGSNRKK